MDRLDEDVLAVLRAAWGVRADQAVETQARALLLDTIGCAVAGFAEAEVRAYAGALAAQAAGAVRFPGLAQALSPHAFAHAFAAAACWHEACEGLAEAHGRPGLHALPAVLGTALAGGRTLGALLDALTVGYEVGGRMGAVFRIRPGMHVDGTWGSLGAAAAAAHLRGLTPEAALGAVQHAACQMPCSLYLPIRSGSTARNAYAGHGAALGMQAAVAAEAGMGGPPGSLGEMARLLLGREVTGLAHGPEDRLILRGYLKRWPAVRHVHYGIACAERWRGDPAGIWAIRLDTYEEALTYCGNRAPETAIQAQFSLSYGVAWTLVHGTLVPAAYAPASLADPLVRRLERMAEIVADPGIAGRGARLRVESAEGAWDMAVDAVPGDPGQPLTRAELIAKFHAFAGPALGEAHAVRLVGAVLEGSRDAPLDLT